MRLLCPVCRSETQVDAACPECAHKLPAHVRWIKIANRNQYEIPAHVHPPMVGENVGSRDAAQ